MSDKEIQRLAVLQDVRDYRLTQVRTAEILSLSTRQITQLLQKLNQDSVSGMVHASRGQPDHHRDDNLLKSKWLSIISDQLHGFGPTLAYEKLTTMRGFDFSVETLRFMIAADLQISRSKCLKRPYQLRYNSECFFELIRIMTALKVKPLNAAAKFLR